MRAANEPSVEEILDSIKKVIARDSGILASNTAAPRAPRIEEDVLDLAVSARFLDEDGAEEPDASLVTPAARGSMRESLAALAMMAEPRAQPQIVRSGETSLEALTRELLRPALAEWLDRNLPAMVERLVAAEIARIVGKTG